MTTKPMESNEAMDKLDQPYPFWLMLVYTVYLVGVMMLFTFPAAGTLNWLEGWLFVGTFCVHMTIYMFYTNQKNPRVLRNRSKTKKEGITAATKKSADSDRIVFPLLGIGMFGSVVVAGLGYRWGWYMLPLWATLMGTVLMHIGVYILNLATIQNAFASKLLDINKGQVLIDTGLYAHVRHPLYSGGILMALFMPVALGSLWGMLFALLGAWAMVYRIPFEEEMLLKGMDGYEAYRERVKYKLIPGVY